MRARLNARKSTRTLQKLLDAHVAHLKTQGRCSHVDADQIFKRHLTEAGIWCGRPCPAPTLAIKDRDCIFRDVGPPPRWLISDQLPVRLQLGLGERSLVGAIELRRRTRLRGGVDHDAEYP